MQERQFHISAEKGIELSWTPLLKMRLAHRKLFPYQLSYPTHISTFKFQTLLINKQLGFNCRYEILKVIGKGSFGQVIKTYDHKKQEYVALKLVRNEKRFHRQAEEEIRILDHLKRQDRDGSHNCVQMTDHFNFQKSQMHHIRAPQY